MENTIPFDLFGEKVMIGFDHIGLQALERALGVPLQLVLKERMYGINFCFAAYPILLKIDVPTFEQKLKEYLDHDGNLDKLASYAINALLFTGLYGKGWVEAVRGIYYPAEKNEINEDQEAKNEEATGK